MTVENICEKDLENFKNDLVKSLISAEQAGLKYYWGG